MRGRARATRISKIAPLGAYDLLPVAIDALAENDGVLVDVHNHGHRRAFNQAFDEMGYSCSQWSPHIYYDLLRFGDSTGEGLVKAYFEMVGWPIMLANRMWQTKLLASSCMIEPRGSTFVLLM